MSKQYQAGIHRTRPGKGPQPPALLGLVGQVRRALLLAFVAGGTGMLASCSHDNGRGPNSEMRVDSSVATAETKASASREAPQVGTDEPTEALTGLGRRYRVAVETAYFFAKPEQSTPNGRYLRRGDAFFGEGETNGFVKTGFVQPNGSAGTAWLKVQELSTIAESPDARPRRRSLPAPDAEPVSVEGAGGAAPSRPRPGPGPAAAVPMPGSATRAVVQVGRSYFYNSPDLAVPRKAYCEQGDKVRLGEVRGEAVYVTFTNWEKVTTTGWMKKAGLGIVTP